MLRSGSSVLLALVFLALSSAGAEAVATPLRAPANNLVVKQTAQVRFDWTNAEGEASMIAFSRYRGADADAWRSKTPNDHDSGGSGINGFSGVMNFAKWRYSLTRNAFLPIRPGTWYWRLCTFRVDGSQTGCTLEAEIRAIRFTRVAGAIQTRPRPLLTKSLAQRTLKDALESRFGEYVGLLRSNEIALRCRRASRQRFVCRTAWFIGDLEYEGRAEVFRGRGFTPRVRWRIVETNGYCVATGGSNCVRVRRR